MKTLKKGSTGDDVKKLQNILRITADGKFGPKTEAEVMFFQKQRGLPITGIVDAITWSKLLNDIAPPVVAWITNPNPVHFGAPHVFVNIDLIGLDENDMRLVARYEPEWALEGLSKYKTLSGIDRAWCSLCVNADLRAVGIQGTNSAAASSWSKYGKSCPFLFGAILPIKHKTGGRHVCRFLYWIDEKKQIAATLDGNRGNKFCVAITDLSGKGDVLVGGPRWPKDLPDGVFVSMEDVLKAHPYLKVGSVGNSTR